MRTPLALADLTNVLEADMAAAIAASGYTSGGGAWGEITGTLSTQTDLQAALDAKARAYLANVRDFGAVGNGSTDDTAAINAASLSLRLTGGTLFFPKGTYRVRAALDADGLPWGASAYGTAQSGPRPCFQVFSNTIIAGEGPENTIIKYAAVTTDGPMIHLNSATNITFRDFTLDGNSSRKTRPFVGGESEGIDTKDDCRNLRFENVHVRNIPNEGIDFDNIAWDLDGFQIFVRDCVFENIGGEALHNPNWGVIENCQFRNCAHDRYQGSIIGASGSSGQGAIDISGENVVIRNCSFIDCVRAMHIYAGVGDGTRLGYATGNLTLTGQPAAGQTVTVAGQVYTWRATATLANEITIGTTKELSSIALAQAINGNLALCPANASVRAVYAAPAITTGAPSIVMLNAKAKGASGNSVTFSTTSSNMTASGATLTGGGTRLPSHIRIENCVFENWISVQGAAGVAALDIYTWTNVSITGCTFRGHGRAIHGGGAALSIRDCHVTLLSNNATEYAMALYAAGTTVSGVYMRGGCLFVGASDMVIQGCDISSAYGGITVQGSGLSNVRAIGNNLTTTGNTALGAAGTLPPLNFATAGQTKMTAIGNTVTGGNHGIMMQADSTADGNVVSGVAFFGITLTGTGNTATGNRITAPTDAINNTGGNNSMAGNWATQIPITLHRNGTPEGAITARIGSVCYDTSTGLVFRKTSGSGNTGWVTP